jgi:hypothetical protein
MPKPVQVLYFDGHRYLFEELTCLGELSSTDPTDFGLGVSNVIILVMVRYQSPARTLLRGKDVV